MSYTRLALACAVLGCALAVGSASTEARKLGTCSAVPASGNIGPGVYAQSSTRSSTQWSWSGSSLGQAFHWYVFNGSGVLIADGYTADGSGGGTVVSAGNHYWKVQNLGANPQHWSQVCSG